ncbi:unnamed protein product [Scytosiphon promiscuus]
MTVAGAVTNTGSDGKTLLHSAALSGRTGIIAELLVAGANPYARCSSGETPLDLARRWVDQSTALTVAPAPSPGYYAHAPPSSHTINGGGGGSSVTCGPSPTYSNASGHSWENNVYGYGNTLASPVHSPGWPSPRATEAGLMQLPLPPTPTNYHAASAAVDGGTFAKVPPSPPAYGDVKGDAVGVAWLSETKMPNATSSTTRAEEGTTAATAAAGQAGRSAAAAGGTAHVANSAFYGQEHTPSPATRGRLWAERVQAG